MRFSVREGQLDKKERALVTNFGKFGKHADCEGGRLDILSDLGEKRETFLIGIIELKGEVETGAARNWVNRCKLISDLERFLRVSISGSVAALGLRDSERRAKEAKAVNG
jgi:hypothetical protein